MSEEVKGLERLGRQLGAVIVAASIADVATKMGEADRPTALAATLVALAALEGAFEDGPAKPAGGMEKHKAEFDQMMAGAARLAADDRESLVKAKALIDEAARLVNGMLRDCDRIRSAAGN